MAESGLQEVEDEIIQSIDCLNFLDENLCYRSYTKQ